MHGCLIQPIQPTPNFNPNPLCKFQKRKQEVKGPCFALSLYMFNYSLSSNKVKKGQISTNLNIVSIRKNLHDQGSHTHHSQPLQGNCVAQQDHIKIMHF